MSIFFWRTSKGLTDWERRQNKDLRQYLKTVKTRNKKTNDRRQALQGYLHNSPCLSVDQLLWQKSKQVMLQRFIASMVRYPGLNLAYNNAPYDMNHPYMVSTLELAESWGRVMQSRISNPNINETPFVTMFRSLNQADTTKCMTYAHASDARQILIDADWSFEHILRQYPLVCERKYLYEMIYDARKLWD